MVPFNFFFNPDRKSRQHTFWQTQTNVRNAGIDIIILMALPTLGANEYALLSLLCKKKTLFHLPNVPGLYNHKEMKDKDYVYNKEVSRNRFLL